ncbi:hexokinase type 2 isoform X1 [Hetaerina americana]|uniref:hexokinase type 2 isoform X1 n=1 Tax=Hetaerina americana TaxID=62018 RepID=UPI003A7F576C
MVDYDLQDIQERCRDLILSEEQLVEVKQRLETELNRGLSKEDHEDASVKCFITYVADLPDGTERGNFLALDLGGTNFRVLLIHLGQNCFDMKSKIYAVPQSIMLGTGEGLFDHIAECMANFMEEQGVLYEELPLGFTFSFPCQQEGLTKATLVTWTKGFKCAGAEGKDVVQMLKDAIKRRGDIKIDIMAVLNDTTGTLMSCAYKKHNCRVGVIVGTGANACYVEKLENTGTWKGPRGPKAPQRMVINTEWGAFGDNGVLDFIRTVYDDEIDQNSINPGKQQFEKMISGMYMGELVRLVLVKLVQENLILGGHGSDMLFQRGNFFTKYVSEIEGEKKGEYNSCRMVLEELGLGHANDRDCAAVRYVCECISRRAAFLTSAGVSCLLDRMGESDVTVAVDGSVYRFHPHFHDLMMLKIGELSPHIQFDIMLSEDGSGRGAALVAAVACRLER